MTNIKILGLDADDTLWQNEEFFRMTQDAFADVLSDYLDPDPLHQALLAAERKNLQRYGYGIKGFMLSMIETALEISDGRVSGKVVRQILDLGQDMLDHPINLLGGVLETIPELAEKYHLILITKGDLLHQEQKLARSGLADFFDRVEIVSEKEPQTYQRIFADDAPVSAMVGNSVKSDILPALSVGAAAVHIPAKYEWDLEKAAIPKHNSRFFQCNHFAQLAQILPQISA